MKPRKFPIILNSICFVLYVTVAIAYFLASEPLFGWLWGASSLLWGGLIYFSVKTYRFSRRVEETMRDLHRRGYLR